MIEIKHTTGPWTIDERFPGSYAIEPNVAWLGASSSHQPGENFANARLIAAAPELLAALQSIMSSESAILTELREQAERAIAKAKGEL
jgi:hypothetical protein